MNPDDYTSAFAGLPDPSTSFMQGVQNGAGIQQLQVQQQQQQVAQAQAQQMHADLADLAQNPTTPAIAAMSIKYPQLSDKFKVANDMLTPEQQRSRLNQATQVYAALQSGALDVADKLLTDQGAAARNSGNEQDAKAAETMASLIKAHPEFAKTIGGLWLSSTMGPDKFVSAFSGIGTEQRANDLAPGAVRQGNAEASGKEADNTLKNLGIVGQTLGSLQGKGAKPAQAQAAIRSLAARGVIPAGDVQGLLDQVPADPKQLDDWLGQQRAGGMKPDDQMKYAAPDANTVANNRTSLAVQDRIDARAKAESDGTDDVASFTPQAIDNAAARYNVDGTLPPMGMGKAAAAGRTKILNRAAELKLGVSPEQQRIDQLSNKGDVAARNASVLDFSSKGKSGQAIQAANTSLNHLETVEHLAMAQRNGNTRLFNQMANKLAAEFGGTAPTNLNAALSMVAPEVSKAVIGASGTGEERAAFEHRFAGNGSPEQALQGIGTIKELLGGRLTESQRTYERTTKKTDFDSMLSPAAKRVVDRAHQAAHAGPAVGAVDGGFRFKGGDPSKPTSWEKI